MRIRGKGWFPTTGAIVLIALFLGIATIMSLYRFKLILKPHPGVPATLFISERVPKGQPVRIYRISPTNIDSYVATPITPIKPLNTWKIKLDPESIHMITVPTNEWTGSNGCFSPTYDPRLSVPRALWELPPPPKRKPKNDTSQKAESMNNPFSRLKHFTPDAADPQENHATECASSTP